MKYVPPRQCASKLARNSKCIEHGVQNSTFDGLKVTSEVNPQDT